MDEPRFDLHEMDDRNDKDLLRWFVDGELIGVVDEQKGGIIGYINRTHIEEVLKLLNK